MHAGERRVGADFSPDRGEFGQTNRRVDFISGARTAAAKLDDREPDCAHVNAGDEASRFGRRVDEHRRLRQLLFRARDEILRAAERGDHALEPLRRGAGLKRASQCRGARIRVVREPGEREQFGAERDRHLVKALVAPRAGQIVDRVADLDRVAGGAGERLVHVGDERNGRQAGVVGDRRDAGRELSRSIAELP